MSDVEFLDKYNTVMVKKNILSEDECNELIDLCNKKNHQQDSVVVRAERDVSRDIKIDKTDRNSTTINITQLGGYHDHVADKDYKKWDIKFAEIFNSALDDYRVKNSFLPVTGSGDYSILKYKEGGFYKTHTDDGCHLERVLSGLVYFNKVEKGGGLYLSKQKITITPEPGMIVFFPSNFCYPHASLPVIKGVKYSLVGWFNY